MEKNEKRAVIKYLLMKGLSAQQIHLDMKEGHSISNEKNT